MKEKLKKLSLLLVLTLLILVGCGKREVEPKMPDNGKLNVVATNTIIADMVKNVAGDNVNIHSLVPVGTDPHEHEIVPDDTRAVEEADVVFYNGLNLETGNGWFDKLIETTNKNIDEEVFAVSKTVEPIYLKSDEQNGKEDPHAWLALQNGIKYVETIRDVLKEKDSANATAYEENASNYIEKLNTLDQEYKDSFNDIPQDKRLLVTSEGAFKYFSEAYGLEATYVWEINTEEQGTPEQMRNIIDKVRASKVPALFVETSVNPRAMERLSKETNRPIYSEVYTDSVGSLEDKDPDIQKQKEDFDVDTYYGMIHWDLAKIHEGLSL